MTTKKKAFIDEVAKKRILIGTMTDPAEDALAAIAKGLRGADMVLVGESQHYTKQFNVFANRLFAYLAENEGFTTFVYETPFAAAAIIDRFVQGENIELTEALNAGICEMFCGWESIRDLVLWMRAYNMSQPEKRIHFYGADIACEGPYNTMKLLLAYLSKVDPAFVAGFEEDLRESEAYTIFRYVELTADQRDHLAAQAARITERLRSEGPSYAAKTGKESWAFALQAAVNLERTIMWFDTFARTGSFTATDTIRDGCMADNLKWILEKEGERGGILFHSHNEHARKELRVGGYISAGAHLAFLLPDQKIISLACMSKYNLRPDDTCPEDCLQDALGKAEDSDYLIDLHSLTQPEAISFMKAPLKDRLSTNFTTAVLADSYDMIAFTNEHLSEDTMVNQPYESAIIDPDESALSEYEGIYSLEHSWFPGDVKDCLTILSENGRLYSHCLNGPDGKPDAGSTIAEHAPVAKSELFQIGEDKFIWKNYCGIIQFLRSEEGTVKGLEYSYYNTEQTTYPARKIL